ncbi:MAG: IclR family transcriptional regulator, partial [bacterium]|nr:IclR family transcriptional regulator [bacterium]
LLTTLTEEHLLVKNPETGRYRLGLAMYDLGNTAVTGLNLHAALTPPMNWLQDATGGTVHAGVLDLREVIYIERLDSPHMLRLFIKVGRRQPAHSTSTGKCLLAHLDGTTLDRILDGWKMESKTAHTITDTTTLRSQLAEIRRLGYACNLEESELGVISVSAPIRDRSRTVVAAVSVAGPKSRLEPEMLALTQSVLEAAAVVSHQLGYRR